MKRGMRVCRVATDHRAKRIIGEGCLRNGAEKRDASARDVLGLGCVDVLNVGFERVQEIDDFAASVRKVSPVWARCPASAEWPRSSR